MAFVPAVVRRWLTGLGLLDENGDPVGGDSHAEDHASRHASGGADAVKLDDLATPDDNTDLNASTTRHGLTPKLPGNTTTFFRGDGTFAGPLVGNLWTMNKSSSQTLDQNVLTQVTFDTAAIDGGGSVIDLANDKFEGPATGLYMVFATWLWETTAPTIDFHMSVKIGTTESIAILRGQPVTASIRANGGHNGSGPLSLVAGDDVTLWIQPGNVAGVTARGNALAHLATTFTLVRIA